MVTLEHQFTFVRQSMTSAAQRVAIGMIHLLGIALVTPLARTLQAQSPPPPATVKTALGVWRGASVCLVRQSACNDESVVYRITPLKAADSLALDARKIVRGEEQEMGVLGCRQAPPSGEITCAIPRGVWRFRVRSDSLTGELRLLDDTKFREVRTARALK